MDSITVSVSQANTQAGKPLYVTESSFDAASATVPDSILYRVDDITGGITTEIRTWTPAAVGDTTSVILDAEDVEMLDANDLKEYRQVTFQVVKGATTITETGQYLVTNFGFQSIVLSLQCDMTHELERYAPLPSPRISRVVDLDNWNP